MATSSSPNLSDLSVDFQAHYDQLGALLQRIQIKEDELNDTKELLRLRDQEIVNLKRVEGENDAEIMRLLAEVEGLRKRLLRALHSQQSSLEVFRDRGQDSVGVALDLWGIVASEIEGVKSLRPHMKF